MKKSDFYRLTEMDKHNPKYAILLGERANGKSFAVKERALIYAIRGKCCGFALIRRYSEDIKSSLMQTYFNDAALKDIIRKETDDEYDSVTYWQGYFYIAKLDEKGNYIRGYRVGAALSLNEDERYKSSFVNPDIKYIIFEEFTTQKLYLKNEVERFMNLCSTILRLESGTIYMIANKISRVCPYFSEWNLRSIPTMKEGQLDEYIFQDSQGIDVKICVELCASPQHSKSGMFFGNIGKTIDGGQWRTIDRPKLQGELPDYDILYSMSLIHMDFKFNILLLHHKEQDFACVYVYPASVHTHDRKLMQTYDIDFRVTPTLQKNNRAEVLISHLIRQNKMVFASNLIAEDFYTVINNMDTYPFNLV